MLQAAVFDPKHVYTFHIRQHLVDVANYTLPTSLGSINLLSYLKGQPLRFMAVDIDSKVHLWNLEVGSLCPCYVLRAVSAGVSLATLLLLQAWHRQLLHNPNKGELADGSSSYGARASLDSLNEALVASPTVAAHTRTPSAASFASDSPLAISGTHSNDPFDDRPFNVPV